MKKIFVCILTLILSFSFIVPVNAKEITFEEVAKTFKENFDKLVTDDGEPLDGSQYNISYTENTLTYFFSNSEGSYEITFNYADGVISYVYPGDKEDAYEVSTSDFFDSYMIAYLIYSVGIVQGYTETEMRDYILAFDEEKDHSDIGMHFTFFDYDFTIEEDTADGGHGTFTASGRAIDTFSININEFRLNTPVEEEPTTDTTPSDDTSNPSMSDVPVETPNTEDLNNIENPQTGFMGPLLFVGLSLIFIIYSLRRKNIFKKI